MVGPVGLAESSLGKGWEVDACSGNVWRLKMREDVNCGRADVRQAGRLSRATASRRDHRRCRQRHRRKCRQRHRQKCCQHSRLSCRQSWPRRCPPRTQRGNRDMNWKMVNHGADMQTWDNMEYSELVQLWWIMYAQVYHSLSIGT